MHSSAKSGLFLIEMIIAIAFFSLAAAICTNLFVRAHVISTGTRDVNLAVLKAQSVAEVFKAANGSPEKTVAYFSMRRCPDDYNTFAIDMDHNWNAMDNSDNAAYQVHIKFDQGSALKKADISIWSLKHNLQETELTLIFDLEVKQYAG